jgi:hypothetical protein
LVSSCGAPELVAVVVVPWDFEADGPADLLLELHAARPTASVATRTNVMGRLRGIRALLMMLADRDELGIDATNALASHRSASG